MKRRFILMILLLSAAVFSASAYTDSFAAMNSNPLFGNLITALKNEEKESTVISLYEAYVSSDITMTERSRIEYHMARYYKDIKNKTKAREHLDLEGFYMDQIGEEASEYEKLVAEVDYTSARYYVNKEMSVGIENSKLTKALYEKYPDEFYAAITECWRLIYTPAIAGGSYRKAIRMLKEIEKNKEGISYLEESGLYTALGYAHAQREEYDDAYKYLTKAKTFYKKDPLVLETLKDVEEKRGN